MTSEKPDSQWPQFVNARVLLVALVVVSLVFILLLVYAWQLEPLDTIKVDDAQVPLPVSHLVIAFLMFMLVSLDILVGIYIVLRHIMKDEENKIARMFPPGQLTQLIVVIIISCNVATLGVLKILDKSEIGAIYGGIVGYVLGKSTREREGDERLSRKEQRKK